ncbi:hypothetical protein FZW96_13220 [Bacillus sp. BGMRC 2118]|nr:hypothetical protein FZW96_13220 [Bacillus sp. BGMRC 2118]
MDEKLKDLRSAMDRTVLNGDHFTDEHKQKIKASVKKSRGLSRERSWVPKSLGFVAVAILVLFVTSIMGNELIDRNNSNQAVVEKEETQAHNQKDQVRTIQTYLEKELTGPSEELGAILGQEELYPPELFDYFEESYGPLVVDLNRFINTNFTLIWLRYASDNGYQLKPVDIDIKKIDNIQNDAYRFEVKVHYRKDGKANTVTVKGRADMTEEGKIIMIRDLDDSGLTDIIRTEEE